MIKKEGTRLGFHNFEASSFLLRLSPRFSIPGPFPKAKVGALCDALHGILARHNQLSHLFPDREFPDLTSHIALLTSHIEQHLATPA